MNKFRIYGKTIRTWEHEQTINSFTTIAINQYEIAYTDYTTTGRIVGKGTEDFSPERRSKALDTYSIWTWDGKSRNAGGHRRFECENFIIIKKSDRKKAIEYLKSRYPAAVEIQLRNR